MNDHYYIPRILIGMGTEVRIFAPHGLPLPDSISVEHPKVAALRALSQWPEGQVSTRHGPAK